MHENLLSTTTAHGCACGHHHDVEEPVLIAGEIPHAIRHGAILGAVSQLTPGASMILVASHDPKPLLRQLAEREGEAVAVEYVERGPEEWRLRLARN
ncbi:MAG TPA: DUF2249 domain-containing protein [Actinomycetaceae bacterium]|nr:DUF2249 domain-containing protein [Actinomycetaceae bacterium]